MTTKDALHQPVEELPDEQTDLACALPGDLRNAADIDGPPLDADALASLDRGLADIAAGRVKVSMNTSATEDCELSRFYGARRHEEIASRQLAHPVPG
jgi:hypothetical protein